MGAIGGSIWHFFQRCTQFSTRCTPRRCHRRRKNSSAGSGGSFAVWGLLYSSFDCGLQGIRRKEDPWNSIAAGAAAGGILSVRHGTRAVGRNAVISGLLLALIEGMGIALNRFSSAAAVSPEEIQRMREEAERVAREKARASDGLAGVGAWATADSQV